MSLLGAALYVADAYFRPQRPPAVAPMGLDANNPLMLLAWGITFGNHRADAVCRSAAVFCG